MNQHITQSNVNTLKLYKWIVPKVSMDKYSIIYMYFFFWLEVVKQEKVLDTLRDSIDYLRTEIVNMEQDIRLLELHLAEKLKVLYFSKVLSRYLLGVACTV
jgi:hypothetical protein